MMPRIKRGGGLGSLLQPFEGTPGPVDMERQFPPMDAQWKKRYLTGEIWGSLGTLIGIALAVGILFGGQALGLWELR